MGTENLKVIFYQKFNKIIQKINNYKALLMIKYIIIKKIKADNHLKVLKNLWKLKLNY